MNEGLGELRVPQALFYFSGLTFRQIGEKLGVSDMAVRESIEVALKKIKKFFD